MKKYWLSNKLLLFITIIFGIISGVTTSFISIIFQKIIDVAVIGDTTGFVRVLIFTLIYVLIILVFDYISLLAGKCLLLKISRQMRADIFSGIMRRPPLRFQESNTADYISALTNDIKLVEENYITPFFLTVQLATIFITTLGILIFLSPLITGILLINMLLMFCIPAMLGKLLQKRQQAVSDQFIAYTEKAKDIFSGFEVISNYCLLPLMKRQFSLTNDETMKKRFAAEKMTALNDGLSETLSTVSIILVIFVSAFLMMCGDITMGTLLALVQLSGTFTTPILLIMQNIPKMLGMKPIIARLNNIAEYNEQEWTGNDAATFDTALDIQCLNFSYTESVPVLKNIHLHLEKGKKYALLGQSGCGKSTLTKLITGCTAQYSGEIYYDGNELKTLDNNSIKQLLSVIQQNVYLFNTSIKNNITLFADFPPEKLKAAINDSGLAEFISGLPDGIETDCGENGSQLSGGQKQRIALARALIRDAEFIILDEATSAVDRKTAQEIESRLLGKDNLTLLTITHSINPALLRRYDQIIHMEDGRISDMGDFTQLAAGGIFGDILP